MAIAKLVKETSKIGDWINCDIADWNLGSELRVDKL